MSIENLIEGNRIFQQIGFKKHQEDFARLTFEGQNPDILFIGCSDSRVVPDLIVDSKPGDMFILRNVGNFVPPYKPDNHFHGSAAAIEYAVSILNVKDIIVCGHSHCGACKALYHEFGDDVGIAHIKKWLEIGKKAKIFDLSLTQEQIYRQTEKASIILQLQNLLTYPKIKEKLDANTLKIHGWYYKIETGKIEIYNQALKVFEEAY